MFGRRAGSETVAQHMFASPDGLVRGLDFDALCMLQHVAVALYRAARKDRLCTGQRVETAVRSMSRLILTPILNHADEFGLHKQDRGHMLPCLVTDTASSHHRGAVANIGPLAAVEHSAFAHLQVPMQGSGPLWTSTLPNLVH